MSLQKQFSLYKLWIELGSFGKCVEYVRSLVDDSEQVSVLRNNVRKFDEAFSDLSNLETNTMLGIFALVVLVIVI